MGACSSYSRSGWIKTNNGFSGDGAYFINEPDFLELDLPQTGRRGNGQQVSDQPGGENDFAVGPDYDFFSSAT